MTFDLTSRRWSWFTLIAGLIFVSLGLLLVGHIESVRHQAQAKANAVVELSRLVAAIHPVVAARDQPSSDVEAIVAGFSRKAREFQMAAPGSPDAERLTAMASRVVDFARERRSAALEHRPLPPARALRAWFGEYVKVQAELARDLPKPIESFRAAVLAGVAASLIGLVILVATRRAYRRQFRELLRTEGALRASEEKFRGLFHNVLEGVYQSSIDGTILDANPALVRMLGFDSVEDLRRVNVARDLYYDPEDRARLTARLREGGVLRNEEFRLRRKDGVEITVLENARIANDSATGAVYFEGSLVDITERKAAEQLAAGYTRQLEEAHHKLELQARQLLEQSFELAEARDKAVQSSRLKSEFLANLSHEVRTPMNGVIGMCQLLLDTGLTPQQSEFAETVRGSAENLLKVLDDILDYSRLETGQFELVYAPFSLRAAVDQVIEQTAARAEAKGLEMTFFVGPGVPDAVSGDAARLRQVLLQIVDNAIRFTTAGEVSVSVSLARDSGEAALIRFQVEDTGIGIPPENFVRLFEPFYQVDASPRRTHGGTGLGLPISRSIVELMGGQLGIESEPGQGSLVWFQVFLARQAGLDARNLETAPLAGRRVLIVDDVASSRGMLSQLLAGWGMRIAAADDTPCARQALQNAVEMGDPFQFVLLDFDLPGLGAVGLAEAILDDPATAGAALFLMVPHSHRGWRDEPLLDGIGGLLPKPIRELHLLEVLTAAVEASRSHDLAALDRGIHPDPEASSIDDPCVLIVEDNPVNQRVTLRLIEKMGLRYELASNGEEALAAVSRRCFDLILMDCQMPIMDGFAATAAIRAGEDGSAPRVPIVAMTANAMQGDRETCIEAGMDDYLTKPVSFEDLRATVHRWLTPGVHQVEC